MTQAKLESTIFVSGPSRSGTAMVRSSLNRSATVTLAGETHYFDDLRPRYADRSFGDLTTQELDSCADYFRLQTVRPYGKGGDPNDSWLTRDRLIEESRALEAAHPRTVATDSIFLAYIKLIAEREDAEVAGEKTPRHVFRIDDILSLLPGAKVVCMVRDPRAVVASYRDWRYRGGLDAEKDPEYMQSIRKDEARSKSSYHVILAAMMWLAAVNAATRAQRKHGVDRVRIVRYEDVVADPEKEIRGIFEWADIGFSAEALEIPLHNSSSADYSAGAGVSTAPQNRWKKVLSKSETSVIEWVARNAMKRHDYSFSTSRTAPLALAKASATLPISVAKAAYANRDRYDSLPKYAVRRLRAMRG